MCKKKIVFLTGTRADFGKLKSLIEITSKSPEFDVHVFATGMHMNSKFGRTVDEIFKSGVKNIYQYINHDEVNSMDRTLAKTIEGFSAYVAELKPDLVVIHGDRVEALAGAAVGSLNNILVAHIEGGELSGTIDDSIRHAVTKLSHVHLVANDDAKKRILQLGEREELIHIIGSPDLDLMSPARLPSLERAKKRYDINFDHFALCAFHPVTTEVNDLPAYAYNYFQALQKSEENYVVIYPNNDLGSNYIIREIEKLRGSERFRIFPSLRFEYFLRILKESKFVVGNSSAGIREAPYYDVPTVNVGTRQNRRSDGCSIINVGYEERAILSGIHSIKENNNVLDEHERLQFGSGDSDKQFLNIISDPNFMCISRQKYFQELDL